MTRLLLRALVVMVLASYLSTWLTLRMSNEAYGRAESREICRSLRDARLRPKAGPEARLPKSAWVQQRCSDDLVVLWHDRAYVAAVVQDDGYREVMRLRLPWFPGGTSYWWMFGTMVTATLLSVVLLWPVVRRLQAIGRVARDFADGDLDARADDAGSDAVGELARHVNIMAERASSGLRSGELLLRLVAHELRTPLTKAGFALELLRSADTDAARDTQIGRLSTAHADLARLIDAVEDRMSVAHSIARARLTPVRVDDCARDALAMVDVDLELVERLDPLTLPGDAELLVRLVRNLVENAARHADSWVLVTVTANPPRIEVADDGPGIAEDQRALVLQPFVRSGSGGVSGLGLPIAASVAQLHRGELTLGTSSRGGLSVTIAFETTRSGVAGPPPAVAG